MSKTLRLCYFREPWAYFTTQPIDQQWGDDWDDAPYEHNAGTPYHPYKSAWGRRPDGTMGTLTQYTDGEPNWRICKIAFEGSLLTPADGHFNSPYCVRDINAGAAPWIRTPDHAPIQDAINAGATPDEFIAFVTRNGGRVYVDAASVLPPAEERQHG